MPKEPISKTCTIDGRTLKLSRDQVDQLERDVASPKRFYTEAWLKDYLDRFTVVQNCAVCGEPLVAEEVEGHGFKHVGSNVRPLLRMYLDLNEQDREAVRDFVAASS